MKARVWDGNAPRVALTGSPDVEHLLSAGAARALAGELLRAADEVDKDVTPADPAALRRAADALYAAGLQALPPRLRALADVMEAACR